MVKLRPFYGFAGDSNSCLVTPEPDIISAWCDSCWLCRRRNSDEMQKHAGSFDFILDEVAADHDISAYINLLRRDGNFTLVGAPSKPLAVSVSGAYVAAFAMYAIDQISSTFE